MLAQKVSHFFAIAFPLKFRSYSQTFDFAYTIPLISNYCRTYCDTILSVHDKHISSSDILVNHGFLFVCQ